MLSVTAPNLRTGHFSRGIQRCWLRLEELWRRVKPRAQGLIDHTPLTAIVDQSKAMRFAYIGPSPDQHAVLSDVRSLLKGIRVLIDPCDAAGSAQNGSCGAFST